MRFSVITTRAPIAAFPPIRRCVTTWCSIGIGLFSWPRLFQELNRREIEDEPARRALDDLLEERIVIQVDAQLVWLALAEGALEETCGGFDDMNAQLQSIAEWQRQAPQLVVLGSQSHT